MLNGWWEENRRVKCDLWACCEGTCDYYSAGLSEAWRQRKKNSFNMSITNRSRMKWLAAAVSLGSWGHCDVNCSVASMLQQTVRVCTVCVVSWLDAAAASRSLWGLSHYQHAGDSLHMWPVHTCRSLFCVTVIATDPLFLAWCLFCFKDSCFVLL